MSNFDIVKKRRFSENGKLKKQTLENAIISMYKDYIYLGISNQNEDIAKMCIERGLSQELFDKLCQLRQIRITNNIPEHILNKELKEKTILECIDEIKMKTDREITDCRQLIKELCKKQFTYEWLSKNDPNNGIIGLLCSCCTVITNDEFYGQDISIASMIASDVQNIVVRNSKGEIISKGAMYINKNQGYAVINDFEMNKEYRNHENIAGRYSVDDNSSDEQEREMIFSAFMRGLQAFIEEYDKQNPGNPLKQINIGMGYNRLKKQVEKYKRATSNLNVPSKYNFKDAMNEPQYILYQRTQKQEEFEGGERK